MEYQPIVSIRSGEIQGAESLVRWDDAVYGKVSPELFIRIAEKLSIYPELAIYTSRQAILDMASILRSNPDFSISINVCSYEILDNNYLCFLDNITSMHAIKKPDKN